MAAINNNNDMIMEVVSHDELSVVTGPGAMSAAIDSQDDIGVADEDILTEALASAPESFQSDNVQFQYTMLDENGELQQGVLLDTNEQQMTAIDTEVHNNSEQITDRLITENMKNYVQNGSENFIHQESMNEVTNVDGEILDQAVTAGEQPVTDPNVQCEAGQFIVASANESLQGPPQQVFIARPVVGSSDSAPLGSSQNPIRIIQQGNQYTPVQQLSTDQLQQIMQVVQQQQTVKSSGSSVLYNTQTNTKIVYRVIYPSQLHKDSTDGKEIDKSTLVTQKRTYKKRIKDDDLERLDGPELSREEKEAKKKMRLKTRSGRVSKPPKHMVKDFKHIHVLDYDEDYDDDDGGYSDFKDSEGEEEDGETPRKDDDNFVAYGVESKKPRNWKCITCGKGYIGRAGLGRHLRLKPSHGTLDPEGEGDMEPPDPSVTPIPEDSSVPTEDSISNTSVTPNGLNGVANSTCSFSEDSRDSSMSLTNMQTPRLRGGHRGRARGFRGRFRGRGAYSKMDPETRRRNKLKEAVRECTDEELMEIVLPRLAKVITLWEFLLMKAEKGDPAWPSADDVYREYERLHMHVRQLCQEYLQYVPDEQSVRKTDISIDGAQVDGQQSLLQVNNAVVAQALGLNVGLHKVKAIPNSDTDVQYQYKYYTTKESSNTDFTNKSILKRTVEVVSPEELASPVKKPRLIPCSTRVNETGEGSIILNSGMNNLSPESSVTWVNMNSSSINHVVTAGVTQSKTLMPTVRIVASNSSSASCPGNVARSGKTVSLLSNSPNKPLSAQSLISSNLTSLPHSSSSNLSQKFIVVSGIGQSIAGPTVPVSSASKNVKDLVQVQRNTSKGMRLATNQGHGQLVALPNTSVQSKVLLHNTVTGTYTVANLETPVQPASNEMKINNQHQMYLKLPPPTPGTGAGFLQPKLVLNDMRVINSSASNNGSLLTEVVNSTSIVTNNDVSHMFTSQAPSMEQDSNGNNVVDASDGNMVFSYQNNVESLSVNNSSAIIPQNIVHSFANNTAANSQENIVFMNPETVFLNKDAKDSGMLVIEPSASATNQSILANENDEGIGVLNNVDNTECMEEIESDPVAEANQLKYVVVKDESGMDKLLELDGESTGDIVQSENVSSSDNIDSMAAIIIEKNDKLKNKTEGIETSVDAVVRNVDVTENNVGLIENNDAVENNMDGIVNNFDEVENDVDGMVKVHMGPDTLRDVDIDKEVTGEEQEGAQISQTTRIFQTDDGLVFIQNPDGTTLQLQGTDGQAVSMETVQALLGMEGDTQIVTELNQ